MFDFKTTRKRLLDGQAVEGTPADENMQLFRPPRAGSAAAAVTAATAALSRRGLEGGDDDGEGRQRRSKVMRVNPVVNLLAHLDDGLSEGHGMAHDTVKVNLVALKSAAL